MLAWTGGRLDLEVVAVIRRSFPYTTPPDTASVTTATPYPTFYEYEYAMNGLQVAEPVISP